MAKSHSNLIKLTLMLLMAALTACQAGMEVTQTANLGVVTPTQGAVTQAWQEETQAPQPTQTPMSVPSPQPELLTGTEINVIYPWIDQGEQKIQAIITGFNQSNPWGIRVDGVSASGYEALGDHLSSGTLTADLIIGQGYDLENAAKTPGFIDLSPMMADSNYGVEGLFRPDSPFEGLTPNSDSPLPNFSIPLLYQPGLIFYNQSWAKELGFPAFPKTTTDWETQLLAGMNALLADNKVNNNGAGGLWLSKTPISALSWYEAFGGGDAAGGYQLDRGHLSSAYSFLKKLYLDDASWTGEEATPYQYFVNRTTLAFEGSLTDIPLEEEAFAQTDSSDEWIGLPYPTQDGNGSVALEPVSFAIVSDDATHQLAAWMFGRYLLSGEAQAAMVEIEGLWPVIGSPAEIAPDYARKHPAWASANLPDVAYQRPPKGLNWAFSRLILQDAAMRVYSLDEQYFPAILDMIDSTLQEFGSASHE